jgi:hypothetical protein
MVNLTQIMRKTSTATCKTRLQSSLHDFAPQNIAVNMPASQNRSNFAFRLGFSTLVTMLNA